MSEQKIRDAQKILSDLDFLTAQQNERAALTLLALLDLKPNDSWHDVHAPLRGITPIMEFAAEYYNKHWAPNTRETVRRFTIHQFIAAGLVVANPDNPARPINRPHNVYQIHPIALETLRVFGSADWEETLSAYRTLRQSLVQRYARERAVHRIPIQIAGAPLLLSPGGQNVLIHEILTEFAPIFAPGAALLYVGDAEGKFSFFDDAGFATLGISLDPHGKMPDIVLHFASRNWLILIEAVTSHGPIHSQRREELSRLFADSSAGLVFVTAFRDRQTCKRHLMELAWETEVWVAEAPTHLIHFNGSRFLGPYEDSL